MTEPTWLTVARSCIGVKETPGTGNNPTIMGWMKKLGARILGVAYTADSTPWCGGFAAHVFNEVGIQPPKIAIRASEWAKWGKPLATPVPGAVLVFTREGGGHVGLFVGHDDKNYHVLGGNQSNSVSITKLAKNRCTAIRWPAGMPVIGVMPAKTQLAGSVSTNEA